jgi:hypothetical protein
MEEEFPNSILHVLTYRGTVVTRKQEADRSSK